MSNRKNNQIQSKSKNDIPEVVALETSQKSNQEKYKYIKNIIQEITMRKSDFNMPLENIKKESENNDETYTFRTEAKKDSTESENKIQMMISEVLRSKNSIKVRPNYSFHNNCYVYEQFLGNIMLLSFKSSNSQQLKIDLYDISFNKYKHCFKELTGINSFEKENKNSDIQAFNRIMFEKEYLINLTYEIVRSQTYFTQIYQVKQAILDVYNYVYGKY